VYVNSAHDNARRAAPGFGCHSPSSQLGALPAILGTAISAGSSILGGLFGGSLDATRKAAVDRRFTMAIQGDAGSLAVLKCWAGIPTPELNNYPALAADVGVNAAGTNCGMAGDAKAYAKLKYEEARARIAAGPVITKAGITIAGAGAQVYPGQALPFVQAIGGTGMLVLVGVAAYLLLRKGRR